MKIKRLLIAIVLVFSFSIGLYGCNEPTRENFWTDGELSLMNFLKVNAQTPIANEQVLTHQLQWTHILGAQYKVTYEVETTANGTSSTTEEYLYTSNSDFSINTQTNIVTMSIPSSLATKNLKLKHIPSGSSQEYELPAAANTIIRLISWKKVADATKYQYNTLNSSQHTGIIVDTFEDKGETMTLRVSSSNGISSSNIFDIENLYYIVEADATINNTGYTQLRNPNDNDDRRIGLSSIFGEAYVSLTNPQKNLIDVITGNVKFNGNSVAASNNLYSALETNYLYFLRSAMVNVTEYAKLLQTSPPTLTGSNRGEIAAGIKEIERRVDRAQQALKALTSDFKNLAIHFQFNRGDTANIAGSAQLPTANFLTEAFQPQANRVKLLEKDLGNKYIPVILELSDYMQEFCEKYYNTNPSIAGMIANSRIRDDYGNLKEAETKEKLFENAVTNNGITANHIRYALIKYQQSLLASVYNYYFKSFGGTYSATSDAKLFTELRRINDEILKTNAVETEFTITTLTRENFERNLIKPLLELETMSNYFKIESSYFIKALENVDLSRISVVETAVKDGDITWRPVEGKTFYMLCTIKNEKTNALKLITIHNLPANLLNNELRLYKEYMEDYVKLNYPDWNLVVTDTTDATSPLLNKAPALYAIDNNPFTIAYNDKILSFIYESLNVNAAFVNTVMTMVNKNQGSTNFYYQTTVATFNQFIPPEA